MAGFAFAVNQASVTVFPIKYSSFGEVSERFRMLLGTLIIMYQKLFICCV